MKNILQLSTLIFVLLLSSCQKEFSITQDDISPADTDAQKFIDSSGTTNEFQKVAINNFVVQLKKFSLWSKFKAIYPMMGGAENTAKWNLINSQNTDAAYRLTFYGSPVYSATGVLFPAVSDYADTHLTDNTFSYNDCAISYYSMTQNTVNGYDMGCLDYGYPANELAINHSADASEWFGFHMQDITTPNTKGLFILSSTLNNVKRYEGDSATLAKGSPPFESYTNAPILIGKVKGAASGGKRECALATIGYGLSDQEVVSFYQIVLNFEADLGR